MQKQHSCPNKIANASSVHNNHSFGQILISFVFIIGMAAFSLWQSISSFAYF